MTVSKWYVPPVALAVAEACCQNVGSYPEGSVYGKITCEGSAWKKRNLALLHVILRYWAMRFDCSQCSLSAGRASGDSSSRAYTCSLLCPFTKQLHLRKCHKVKNLHAKSWPQSRSTSKCRSLNPEHPKDKANSLKYIPNGPHISPNGPYRSFVTPL